MGNKSVKVGYYPGCALLGTGKEYDISIRKVNEFFDVELAEIEDWSCCGASSAHMTSFKMNVALNARNLILAEQQGFREVLAPCPLCSRVMLETHQLLTNNPDLNAEMGSLFETPYQYRVSVINYLQFVERYYAPWLEEKIKMSFTGLSAACYYGCLLTRPPEVLKFDDAEQPQTMEALVHKMGIETVDWEFRTECCGGGFTLADAELVTTLSCRILDDALLHGADAIIVACPMCHANLDMRQLTAREKRDKSYSVPIIYLSELLGLCLGLSPEDVSLSSHITGAGAMLQKRVST